MRAQPKLKTSSRAQGQNTGLHRTFAGFDRRRRSFHWRDACNDSAIVKLCAHVCSAPLAVLGHLEREDFDVVLTDYHMPEMTGIDLAHQLRLKKSGPVILMTGLAKDEVAAKMDCSNLALILQKTLDLAGLVHAITTEVCITD